MKASKFIAMLAIAAGIMACTEQEEKDEDSISATPSTVTFEADGGAINVAVAADVYKVDGAEAWLTCVPKGRELALTAEPNTERSARSCTLTLTNGTASCKVTVNQKAGSPYLGYSVANSALYEYAGTLLYAFFKPVTPDYGGMAYITLETEDVTYSLQIYTELFKSAEEVKVEEAEYTVGQDDYSTLTIYAVPSTFSPGVVTIDEDDIMAMGSTLVINTSEETRAITGGTIKVFAENGGITILADVIDDKGENHKVVYEGALEADTTGAGYPSEGEHLDPTQNVFYAGLSLVDSAEGV